MELVHILIWFAVLAIVGIVAWYILSQVPLPDPIRRIVTIALVVFVAVVVIIVLLQLGGVVGGHLTTF